MRGEWRLHPQGKGQDAGPGEPITSPRILAFIGRNYQADAAGRWYFQNGPQRVYVRLDAAPWILHTETDARGHLRLATHAGQAYGPIDHWWLTPEGLLYTQSRQGGGLIAGRDLPQVLDALVTADGRPLTDWLEAAPPEAGPLRAGGQVGVRVRFLTPACGRQTGAAPEHPPCGHGPARETPLAPLGILPPDAIEATLGFVRRPRPGG
jgi:hypothetical protein